MSKKHYMCRFATAVLFAAVSIPVWADVTGRIVTENGEGIPECAVTLLAPSDSTYVDATVSDSNGGFLFETEGNDFLVSTQCYGFKKALVHFNGQPLTITLSHETSDLNEVTVTAMKPGTLKREANKFIYVPDALPGEVHVASDVLKIIPMITFENGILQMIGKSQCIVYVNGRPPRWGQGGTLEILKTINPDKIKHVEIITNPDASLSASSDAGILNLIMDEPDWGFRGSTSLSVNGNFSKTISTSPSFLADYVHDKFSVTGIVGYSNAYSESHNKTTYDYTNPDYSVTNDLITKKLSNAFDVAAMASYRPNDKSDMGVIVSTTGSGSYERNFTDFSDSRNPEVSHFFSGKKKPFAIPVYTVSAYYYLNTDNRGSKFDIHAHYMNNKPKSSQSYEQTEDSYVKDEHLNNQQLFASTKYTHNFADYSSLSGGIDFNFNDYDLLQQHEMNTDRFLYKEYLTSLFLTYNRRWTPFIFMMAGARLEYDHASGIQEDENVDFTHNDWNVVPRISFSFSLPKAYQSIGINYSMTIVRPSAAELNPFKFWTTPTTYTCGNPDLGVSTSHMVDISYSLLNKFMFDVSYYLTPKRTYSFTYDDGQGNTATTFKKFGKFNRVFFFLNYYSTFFNKFRLDAKTSVSYTNTHSWIENRNLSYSNWSVTLNLRLSYTLAPLDMQFSIQDAVTNPARDIDKNSDGWHNFLSLSVDKYFKCGLSTSFSFNVFNGTKDTRYYSTEYSYISHSYDPRTRFSFSLSYTFGNKSIRNNNAKMYNHSF